MTLYTPNQLLRIIKQGREQLDLEDYINFLIIIPFFLILLLALVDLQKNILAYSLVISCTLLLIIFTSSRILANKKFTSIYTGKSKKENQKFARKTLKVTFGNYQNHKGYIQAKTNGNFFYAGDLFTVISVENFLLINYRPIPFHKGATISFYSGIRNFAQFKKQLNILLNSNL